MPKATFRLPDGTEVHVDGSVSDIKLLLDHYASLGGAPPRRANVPQKKLQEKEVSRAASSDEPSLSDIINFIKDSDEAENIEKNILDRTSQVDRALLPLFILHEHYKNSAGLKTGDIAQICHQLGIPISQANVSHTLAGTASKYIVADGVRKKGQPTRYKLSRRGVQYIKAVITGSADAR